MSEETLVEKQADILFTLICQFLWTNISIIHHGYFDRPESVEHVNKRLGQLDSNSEEIARWLVEQYYRDQRVSIPFHVKEEQISGQFMENYIGSRLNEKARQASIVFPAIDEMLWLYYYACAWLEHTLIETERLMFTQPLLNTTHHKAYLAERNKFEDLINILRQERRITLLDEDLTHVPPKELRVDLDVTAQELSALWRELILETVVAALKGKSR